VSHIPILSRVPRIAILRRGFAIFLALVLATPASAQWEIQNSGGTTVLRGIHAIGNGIAWASGTEGTVLRTIDDGKTWQRCATPPDAGHLDFRGIQAFDAQTAIVMSSGKGPLSRLYKTTDACQSWTLLFTNPDPDGFWDALIGVSGSAQFIFAEIAGDPVDGMFTVFRFKWFASAPPGPREQMGVETVLDCRYSGSAHDHQLQLRPGLCAFDKPGSPNDIPAPLPGESLFAASNSSLILRGGFAFVTGGPSGARFLEEHFMTTGDTGSDWWTVKQLPLAKSVSGGAFSIARASGSPNILNVVGGDYLKPNEATGTAAFTTDNGEHWAAAQTPPHGYRSAVAYDAATKTWITVGPNGTDISTDDGRNWRALLPTPGEAPDSAQHWNALSLPFVVGPHGRIGKLRPAALKPAPQPRAATGATP